MKLKTAHRWLLTGALIGSLVLGGVLAPPNLAADGPPPHAPANGLASGPAQGNPPEEAGRPAQGNPRGETAGQAHGNPHGETAGQAHGNPHGETGKPDQGNGNASDPGKPLPAVGPPAAPAAPAAPSTQPRTEQPSAPPAPALPTLPSAAGNPEPAGSPVSSDVPLLTRLSADTSTARVEPPGLTLPGNSPVVETPPTRARTLPPAAPDDLPPATVTVPEPTTQPEATVAPPETRVAVTVPIRRPALAPVASATLVPPAPALAAPAAAVAAPVTPVAEAPAAAAESSASDPLASIESLSGIETLPARGVPAALAAPSRDDQYPTITFRSLETAGVGYNGLGARAFAAFFAAIVFGAIALNGLVRRINPGV